MSSAPAAAKGADQSAAVCRCGGRDHEVHGVVEPSQRVGLRRRARVVELALAIPDVARAGHLPAHVEIQVAREVQRQVPHAVAIGVRARPELRVGQPLGEPAHPVAVVAKRLGEGRVDGGRGIGHRLPAYRTGRGCLDGRVAGRQDSSKLLRSGKFVEVDGRRFLVKGVAYGTFEPDADGSQFPPLQQVARDFALMADAGFNTVRTYTVPTPGVLDEAARHGLNRPDAVTSSTEDSTLADVVRIGMIQKMTGTRGRSCSRTCNAHTSARVRSERVAGIRLSPAVET